MKLPRVLPRICHGWVPDVKQKRTPWPLKKVAHLQETTVPCLKGGPPITKYKGALSYGTHLLELLLGENGQHFIVERWSDCAHASCRRLVYWTAKQVIKEPSVEGLVRGAEITLSEGKTLWKSPMYHRRGTTRFSCAAKKEHLLILGQTSGTAFFHEWPQDECGCPHKFYEFADGVNPPLAKDQTAQGYALDL